MARASPSFDLRLLGAFRLERDAQIIHLPTRKFEALLAYLALFPESHPREKLAAIFWGDTPDEQARASLRNALAVLRKYIADDIVQADRETVQINPAFPLWVDARTIFDLQLPIADLEIEHLKSKIENYAGDLLPDWYDDWILPERERLRTIYINALLKLAQQMRSQSDYPRALAFSRQVLALDPGNEKAHQNIMFCFVATGNRSAALKQYEECERILREDIGVEPLPETQSLYQWVKRAEERAASPEARLTNLPTPLTDFIGRIQETAELEQLIAQKRLVTLTGAGGCGKTRLAIHVASHLVDAFHDGVWWVDLAPISENTFICHAIASALGARESASQSLSDVLVSHLRGKRLLLLLDGCERLVEACAPLVEKLSRQCSEAHFLITGRETLNIHGETVWQVSALAVPENTSPRSSADWMRYDSVRLFVNRAAASKPGFALTDQNARAVGEICARLDGIPLALELAAARVKTLTVAQIAERLNDRFRLLTDGSRTALPHHQTLRAAIDWSYDALSNAERVLFCRLSAFIRGWTLEAAEQAMSDAHPAGLKRAEILDVLTHLVTKSLVIVESSGDEVRYRMLETMREYAREKLIASGEAAEIFARHRDYFLAFAEATEPKLRRAGQMLWLDRVDADYENLRAAMRWSLRREKLSEHDIECGLRIVGALRHFWAMRCLMKDGQAWLSDALTLGARLESIAQNPVLQSARAKALNGAGILAYLQGEQVRAAEFSEKGVEIARALNDRWLIAANLFVLGEYQRNHLQNIAQAQALVEEGLLLARVQGDDWLTAVLLLNAALQSRLLGDYARTTAYLTEGLALIEKVGDKWIASALVDNLGSLAYLEGDYLRAIDYYGRALALRRELADKTGVAGSLHALGQATRCQGDSARALELFQASLELWQELDQKDGIGQVLQNIARVLLQQGDLPRAAEYFRQSLEILFHLGAHENLLNGLTGVLGWLSAQRQFAKVARLSGAIEARHANLQMQLPPADFADSEKCIHAARAELGDPVFFAARAEGKQMSLEQTAHFAMRELNQVDA